MPDPVPTRQRLVEAGMRLFADQGFGATSVADIEVSVGLQPRRGGLYKHFANKQALLETAVQAYLDDAAAAAGQIVQLDVAAGAASGRSTLRALLLALGRWFLDEMDRLEDLTRVLEHDASRLPQLIASVKTDIVDLSYRTAAGLIATVAPRVADPAATSIVVLGSLVALRRTAWTFGDPPLGIDDERFLNAWADALLATLTTASPRSQPSA
jgi:AcrR family transcriptional regulator